MVWCIDMMDIFLLLLDVNSPLQMLLTWLIAFPKLLLFFYPFSLTNMAVVFSPHVWLPLSFLMLLLKSIIHIHWFVSLLPSVCYVDRHGNSTSVEPFSFSFTLNALGFSILPCRALHVYPISYQFCIFCCFLPTCNDWCFSFLYYVVFLQVLLPINSFTIFSCKL
jgi:hypothetical protein